MTIDLEDGLEFDEVLQIAKWLRVAEMLKPELHDRLSSGTDSLLNIMEALQRPEVSWLVGILGNFIPGLGGQLNGGVDALRVMKELLAA